MYAINALRHGCLAIIAAVGLLAAPAWANYAPAPQVDGAVTAVIGQTGVTINGHTYLIASYSAAYHTIQSVHVGDQVGLVLDGPGSSSSSHVIAIVIGFSRTGQPGRTNRQ